MDSQILNGPLFGSGDDSVSQEITGIFPWGNFLEKHLYLVSVAVLDIKIKSALFFCLHRRGVKVDGEFQVQLTLSLSSYDHIRSLPPHQGLTDTWRQADLGYDNRLP